ncbi:MAG TPA: sigma-70 family RNA polymerase sigma factor [Pirellulales bacterium]|jgi:RNA polymerase sigma-70 factor (ECF subfamily)|nr:sigma-70 family RNA polymerase sigma factor [Pirellulales bacterium]
MTPHDFARLLDDHCAALILYARQWCDSPEDIVQEAFLKLVAARRQPENAVAWLFRVVRNAAIDASRQSRRRQRREAAAARPDRWFVEDETNGLTAGAAVNALQTLPLDQREVIVARLWGGLGFEEIAEIAGCSQSTAFRRFSSGVEALRKELNLP